MQIAVLTAVWRRYTLTALYWQWMTHLRAWWAPHDVHAFVAVSDDEHESMAQNAGARTIRVLNAPAGQKFSAVLMAARDHDAVLVMGSDDFLCRRTADALLAACTVTGATYVGLEDLYFLRAVTGSVRYWSGHGAHRRGEPAGCGRLFHRNLLEACDWKLWPRDRHRGFDAPSHAVAAAHAEPHVICLREIGGTALDVKTAVNLNLWQDGWGPEVESTPVLGRLPPDVAEGLRWMQGQPEELLR